MRILLLTQVLPYPPDSGGKIKTFNLLRYLAGRHELVLASLIRSDEELRYLSDLRPCCRRLETAVLRWSRVSDRAALLRGLATGVPGIRSCVGCHRGGQKDAAAACRE